MKNVAIVTGILLIAVGLFGYGMPQTVVTDELDGQPVEKIRSWTALFPAIFGLPILLCGLWALINSQATKIALHIAASFGLLGALAASVRGGESLLSWVRADDGTFNGRTFVFVALMAIICWMFVVSCIASFVRARKARESTEPASQ